MDTAAIAEGDTVIFDDLPTLEDRVVGDAPELIVLRLVALASFMDGDLRPLGGEFIKPLMALVCDRPRAVTVGRNAALLAEREAVGGEHLLQVGADAGPGEILWTDVCRDEKRFEVSRALPDQPGAHLAAHQIVFPGGR